MKTRPAAVVKDRPDQDQGGSPDLRSAVAASSADLADQADQVASAVGAVSADQANSVALAMPTPQEQLRKMKWADRVSY